MLNHTAQTFDRIAALALAIGLGVLVVNAQSAKPEERIIQSDPRSILTQDVLTGKAMMISSIADGETRDVREAPAHVQVITARQIEASGARDLYDVLGLVPGLAFGRGENDAVGVSLHGNWAGDGQCLFLLNGAPLNENDYGSFAIGQRVPLSNVDRIEVVMGPGTMIHGSTGALGVINIITRSADEAPGTQGVIRSGATKEGITRTLATVSGAHRLSRDQDIGYLLSNVRGRNSNALGLMPDSTLLSFKDSTAMQASAFQFNYRWRQLKAYMNYQEESFDVSDAEHRMMFRNVMMGLEYRITLAKNMELTTKLSHSDQAPWYFLNTTDPQELAMNTANQRTSASLFLSHHPTNWLNVRVGAQGYHQRTQFQARTNEAVFALTGTPTHTMNDGALFAEATVHGTWGNFTAGQRFEHNDLAGSFTAPRLAYTLARGHLHGKLLWSKAFRMPTVMNLNYRAVDGSLGAEHVTNTEAELGTKLGASAQFTLNLYETRIDDPIVRIHDPATAAYYVNRAATGSQGIDLRFSLDLEKWTVLTGFGTHRAIAGDDLPERALPADAGRGYHGIPSTRAFALVSYDASPRFSLRTRAQWQAPLWSYQYTAPQDTTLYLMEHASQLILNAGVTVRPTGKDRLGIELGCNNILDQRQVVLSPYTNGLNPLIRNGREFTLAIIFKFVQ